MDLKRTTVDAGHHVGLARNIAIQFLHTGRANGLDLDDLAGEASVALIHAARGFDPSYGKPFAAYGGRVIRNHLINVLQRRRLRTVSWFTDQYGRVVEPMAPPVPEDEREHVAGLLRVLRGRERSVVELRFGLGRDKEELSMKEIAEHLGVSRQRVQQLLSGALERMRAAIEREDRQSPDAGNHE